MAMPKPMRLCALVVALAVLTTGSLPTAQPSAGKVEFHFMNVGQADATLIVDSARKCVILIDSGDTRYPGSAKNFKEYVQKQLPDNSEIALAVVSHPHN